MVVRFWAAALAATIFFTSGTTHAEWLEARSKHFLIYGEMPEGDLKDYALRLEKFDKAVRIVRMMDDPPTGDAAKVTIYVLRDTDQVSWLAVGGLSPIAGFYEPRASGSVAFVPKPSRRNESPLSGEAVFYHEYAHHLMFQSTDVAMPAWLTEGFAEFFTSASVERDGEVKLGTPANHRAQGLRYLSKPSIDMMFGPPPKSVTGEQMEAFYDWAWVYMHYLTFDPKRRGQLSKYVEALERNKDAKQAAVEAFGDLKEFDRDTTRYYYANKFRYLIINNPEVQHVSAGVRKLRPGEDAIMWLRIQSTRGVNEKKAPSLASKMRGVAAQYPTDPFVQRSLAEAEYDAKDYAAAITAADRSIALDPDMGKAYIYRGLARMALARAGGKADWTSIRADFAKANHIDPDDAQALELYYESFASAGQRPTKNAIEGLQYALSIAPQDRELRSTVVVEYLTEGKLKEARYEIAPLAYYPHQSESRDRAQKALAAIDAGNAQQALAALAEPVPGDKSDD